MTRTQIIAAEWTASYILVAATVLLTIIFELLFVWIEPTGYASRGVVLVFGVFSASLIAARPLDLDDETRLKTLLGPATKDGIILAKFVASLCLASFAASIPALVLRDLRFVLNANAVVLLLTTIFVASDVVSINIQGTAGLLSAVVCCTAYYLQKGDFWLGARDYGRSLIYWILAHTAISSTIALGTASVVSRRLIMVHADLHKE